MVNLTFDMREIRRLNFAAEQFKKSADKKFLKQALRSGLRPMLNAAKVEVPVWKGKDNTSSLGRARNNSRIRDRTYDRGGATKRDLRINVADGKAGTRINTDVVGLVGVSKKRERVGWRTHFITRGTRGGIDRLDRRRGGNKANDFLSRAYKRGENYLMEETFRRFDTKVKQFATKINNG